MTYRETTLNDIMGFDHVIRILPDGTVDSNPPDAPYPPELYCETDANGSVTSAMERAMIESARAEGWELLTGWTGQYGYSGCLMHPSEYIGGGLERHIWATPGYWVVLIPSFADDSDDAWVIAYRETGA